MKALAVRALGVLLMLSALAVGLRHAPERPVETLVARWAPPPPDFIEIDGQLVHLRDEGPRGDPAPAVLLHGLSSSLHTWEGWAAALKTQRRVATLDLPGHGLTGPWSGARAGSDYRADTLARFVLQVLDTRGVQRFVAGATRPAAKWRGTSRCWRRRGCSSSCWWMHWGPLSKVAGCRWPGRSPACRSSAPSANGCCREASSQSPRRLRRPGPRAAGRRSRAQLLAGARIPRPALSRVLQGFAVLPHPVGALGCLSSRPSRFLPPDRRSFTMGKYFIAWLLGVPGIVLVLLYLFMH